MSASPTVITNPLRGQTFPKSDALAQGEIETDPSAAQRLFAACPAAHETPLSEAADLAALHGVATLHLKDERGRMGLGSFKALGAVHAIAKRAAEKAGLDDMAAMAGALAGETFICASAGNHGLSVAAGARLFGAQAVVLLADNVPEGFAEKLRGKGADVRRAGADYEASMAESKRLADEHGWSLLSDGTWKGYSDPARDVMEGYLIMGHEAADQMKEPPTHVFLQAGVGGLAAAMAAAVRVRWGEAVTIIVVEPVAAPALFESVRKGKVVETAGPDSNMGRLDCKTPSHLALKYLARETDFFQLITDEQASETAALAAGHGFASTPSGIAGLAGLRHIGPHAELCGIDTNSRVLCVVSEEA